MEAVTRTMRAMMTQRCTGQTLVEHKPGRGGPEREKNKEERRADSRIALVAQAAATTESLLC